MLLQSHLQYNLPSFKYERLAKKATKDCANNFFFPNFSTFLSSEDSIYFFLSSIEHLWPRRRKRRERETLTGCLPSSSSLRVCGQPHDDDKLWEVIKDEIGRHDRQKMDTKGRESKSCRGNRRAKNGGKKKDDEMTVFLLFSCVVP